jgi:hypothetical protein
MSVTVFAAPILRIRVGQDYRSGNVEGAKHPLSRDPPRCVGDVTQSRHALADQKHHRPEDERAHEKGDRRGRYRPFYRPAQLAIDGELYRYRGPRQNGEQRKQSLHLFSFPCHGWPHAALLEEPGSPRRGSETRDTPLASLLPGPHEHISVAGSPTGGSIWATIWV